MKTVKDKLEKNGVTSDGLDEVVCDIASGMASNANNGGMKSQIEFLNQGGFSDEQIWAIVLTDALRPDMSVDVLEPKHDDSPHSCSFTGNVVEVFDEFVRVCDMEDNGWDVSFDEIESFNN